MIFFREMKIMIG